MTQAGGKERPCDYCFGHVNGLDRWYMHPCICWTRCESPKCKGRKG